MDEATWRSRQQAHAERVRPWVAPRQMRRARGQSHPVDDFLFEYYPYSPNRLLTWHPGAGIILEGDADAFLRHPAYGRVDVGVTADIARMSRPDRLALVIDLLDRTAKRPAATHCFALHEWAMVYRLEQDEVRHHALPLRLRPDEITAVVDDIGLRCTHIDAYRFFTPDAVPLNAHQPTRRDQAAFDQPGCLHANMDLYKYASWFSPFIASELVADCFELARRARELDMRASPYDVASFGLASIRVETPEGRREYARAQQRLTADSAVLRTRLLATLGTLHDERRALDVTSSRHATPSVPEPSAP